LNVSSNDLIIIITYPRYSKRTIDVLKYAKYAKEKNTSIITITDSFSSPVASEADVSLIANSEMFSFVDSLVAPMSLINSFIIAVGNEKKDNLNRYFEILEKVWKTYNIYDYYDYYDL